MGGMEVGAIEADGRPMEGAIEGAIEPRSKGDGSRSKGDRTLQIYRNAWFQVAFWSEMDVVPVPHFWRRHEGGRAGLINAHQGERAG
jgi:hypothetical protein